MQNAAFHKKGAPRRAPQFVGWWWSVGLEAAHAAHATHTAHATLRTPEQ
ncbi:MAG: hypothetical protein O3B76_10220 [Proteobacteria bacterium]|nr:hypothetical protein [Pseudomonadota bacterium]